MPARGAAGARAVRIDWRLGDGSRLTLLANFGDAAVALPEPVAGRPLFATGEASREAVSALSAAFFLNKSAGA